MVNFSKVQWVTIGALVGFLLLNPFSVEVLEPFFKWFYFGVFLVCSVWVAGFILYNALKPQVVVVKKTKKDRKDGLKYEY